MTGLEDPLFALESGRLIHDSRRLYGTGRPTEYRPKDGGRLSPPGHHPPEAAEWEGPVPALREALSGDGPAAGPVCPGRLHRRGPVRRGRPGPAVVVLHEGEEANARGAVAELTNVWVAMHSQRPRTLASSTVNRICLTPGAQNPSMAKPS